MKRLGNILLGIILVIIGVIFALNVLEITNIDIFFSGWWTLIIIIPCFIGLFKDNDKTGSLIGLLIGVILLLCCQDVIDFSLLWKLVIPIAIVVIGLSIVIKNIVNGKVKKEVGKLNKDNSTTCAATFSSQTLNYSKKEFKGCELNSVFGSVVCNLKEAIIKEDAAIKASSVFGGITILVPDDVNIKISSNSLFGGVDNKIKNDNFDENKKTIYIDASCVFGGVDIK